MCDDTAPTPPTHNPPPPSYPPQPGDPPQSGPQPAEETLADIARLGADQEPGGHVEECEGCHALVPEGSLTEANDMGSFCPKCIEALED